MLERTRRLWTKQNQHVGDRRRLFSAIAEAASAEEVLYPGSYVDLAPSFVWRRVTYVDVDRRAERFFADRAGVDELLVENGADPDRHDVRFIHADYTDDLGIPDSAFDLLVSLYTGFVSEACTPKLRVGGMLLVNPSHGDAAMASLDPRYRLWGAVTSAAGRYEVRRSDLESYLTPKRDEPVTRGRLHESGRGVAYTRSAFAYLFERIA